MISEEELINKLKEELVESKKRTYIAQLNKINKEASGGTENKPVEIDAEIISAMKTDSEETAKALSKVLYNEIIKHISELQNKVNKKGW